MSRLFLTLETLICFRSLCQTASCVQTKDGSLGDRCVFPQCNSTKAIVRSERKQEALKCDCLFVSLQCRPSKGRRRGYCWCVDKYGQPLPGYDGRDREETQCHNPESK